MMKQKIWKLVRPVVRPLEGGNNYCPVLSVAHIPYQEKQGSGLRFMWQAL